MGSSGPTADRAGRAAGFWRQVRTLWVREVRAALREKTIVVNSLLMPVFLYPFLLWAMFTGMTFVMGQTEGFVSRVLVPEWPGGHPELRLALSQDDLLDLVEASALPGDPRQAIRDGKLEAVLELVPASEGPAALPGNLAARITYDKSKERSEAARERLQATLGRFRDGWLSREAAARDLGDAEWRQFTLLRRNAASGRQMGTLLMGLMLPLFFVVMVAVGCFYPAVDATAGERERNTWETLLTTAARRQAVVVAKYLYVATFGCVAGALNLLAMLVTLKPVLAPILGQGGPDTLEFAVPLRALPVLAVMALLLSGFVAAGMMILAAFARTFKEGQAMVTPFYLLVLVPSMFLNVPGLELSWPLSLVPVVNVTMVVREALGGVFRWPLIGVTLLVTLATIALCLRLAATVLAFEDVVVGSYGGSFPSFFRERVLGRPRARRAGEVTR